MERGGPCRARAGCAAGAAALPRWAVAEVAWRRDAGAGLDGLRAGDELAAVRQGRPHLRGGADAGAGGPLHRGPWAWRGSSATARRRGRSTSTSMAWWRTSPTRSAASRPPSSASWRAGAARRRLCQLPRIRLPRGVRGGALRRSPPHRGPLLRLRPPGVVGGPRPAAWSRGRRCRRCAAASTRMTSRVEPCRIFPAELADIVRALQP